MKTITCSNRIYYSELSSEEANALHQDIQLYHAMMHTAYHLLCLKSQGIPFPFENSLEKEMKRRFHTNYSEKQNKGNKRKRITCLKCSSCVLSESDTRIAALI